MRLPHKVPLSTLNQRKDTSLIWWRDVLYPGLIFVSIIFAIAYFRVVPSHIVTNYFQHYHNFQVTWITGLTVSYGACFVGAILRRYHKSATLFLFFEYPGSIVAFTMTMIYVAVLAIQSLAAHSPTGIAGTVLNTSLLSLIALHYLFVFLGLHKANFSKNKVK